jgi:hypothetical protein
MLRPDLWFLSLAGLLSLSCWAQPSDFGVTVPTTLSGGAMYSERLQLATPNASEGTAGFRAMLYPTVKLGPNWFGYAAIQLRERPYFCYDAFNSRHEFDTDVIQAFAGYSFRTDRAAVVVKAGRLTSAFGAFPARYDDMQNPLLDQPLSYIATLTLRADQIPCGTNDLLRQNYGSVSFSCGGESGRGPGLTPVTLYGLPGAETDVSIGRFDARVQLTSGSPVYEQPISAQYLQWALGGGYTIRQGFRVGVSGFRGPYLEREVAPALPVGTSVRTFPASGLGIDGQWARGRWSIAAEVQRFQFDSPNFSVAPAFLSGYLETKAVITPRLYVAGRAGWLNAGRVIDMSGVSADEFARWQQSYEVAAGWWFGRRELLKGGYEWLNLEGPSPRKLNVVGVQFVVTIPPLTAAFR